MPFSCSEMRRLLARPSRSNWSIAELVRIVRTSSANAQAARPASPPVWLIALLRSLRLHPSSQQLQQVLAGDCRAAWNFILPRASPMADCRWPHQEQDRARLLARASVPFGVKWVQVDVDRLNPIFFATLTRSRCRRRCRSPLRSAASRLVARPTGDICGQALREMTPSGCHTLHLAENATRRRRRDPRDLTRRGNRDPHLCEDAGFVAPRSAVSGIDTEGCPPASGMRSAS